MSDDAASPAAAATTASIPRSNWQRLRRWVSPLLGITGLLLLALAIYATLGSARGAREALAAAQNLRWWHVVIACLVPVCNFALTSLIFWLLTVRGAAAAQTVTPSAPSLGSARAATISYGEMLALITSGTLLNQLPGKPGIIARTLYHKFITKIPIRYTVLVMVQAVLFGGLGVLGSMLAGVIWLWASPLAGLFILCAMLVSGGVAGAALSRRGVQSAPLWICAVAVCGLRTVETLLWTLRYAVMLDVAGVRLGLGEALVVAGASQLAILLPIQVGVREWTVGIVTAMLAKMGAASSVGELGAAAESLTIDGMRPGVLADLLCRGADLAVMVPAGAIASVWVYGRIRRAQARAALTQSV